MEITDTQILALVSRLQTQARTVGAPPALGMILLVDRDESGNPLDKPAFVAVTLMGNMPESCCREATLVQAARSTIGTYSATAAITIAPVKNGVGATGLLFTLDCSRMRRLWIAQRDEAGKLGEFEPASPSEAPCFFGVFDLVN